MSIPKVPEPIKDFVEMSNIVNDCYVDVYGVRPTLDVITRVYSLLSQEVKDLAIQWGWYDTEVREKVYKWMKEKSEIL